MREKKSIGQIKSMYRDAIRAQNRLDKWSGSGDSKIREKWYSLQNTLKDQLYEILSENFFLLSKPQLIRFLAMCSSHRPLEPHAILTTLSIRYDNLYP